VGVREIYEWREDKNGNDSPLGTLRFNAATIVPDEKLATPEVVFEVRGNPHVPVFVGIAATNMPPLYWAFDLALIETTNILSIIVGTEKRDPFLPANVNLLNSAQFRQ
jgi:hypothetical protein